MIGIGEGRERGFEIKLTSDKGYDQEWNSLIIFFQKNFSNLWRRPLFTYHGGKEKETYSQDTSLPFEVTPENQ